MRFLRLNSRRVPAGRSRADDISIHALRLWAGLVAVAVLGAWGLPGHAQSRQTRPPVQTDDAQAAEVQAVLNRYCVGCHNQRTLTANLAFDTLDVAHPGTRPATWEKVVKKLRGGTMPPGGRPRPDADTYAAVAGWLEAELDAAWAADPFPGRIQRDPPPQPHGIQQRHSRPVGARCRCEGAVARGRDGGRELRQLRGVPHDFDGPHGTVHVRGSSGHPHGGRPAACGRGFQNLSSRRAPDTDRFDERRSAARFSWWHGRPPPLSGRR